MRKQSIVDISNIEYSLQLCREKLVVICEDDKLLKCGEELDLKLIIKDLGRLIAILQDLMNNKDGI